MMTKCALLTLMMVIMMMMVVVIIIIIITTSRGIYSLLGVRRASNLNA